MTSKRTDRVTRLENLLRRAHDARKTPEPGEDAVRAVMARVRGLPGYGQTVIRVPREGIGRVFSRFAAASALVATGCAVWSLSVEQGLEWLVMRVVLADPTGLGALRLAGL